VLSPALDDERVGTLKAPARRPLATIYRKLVAPIVRSDDLPADAAWWQTNVAICSVIAPVGTTA